MYLKKIELHGFKSFPRPTTLEFKTPITAIVGPNGSGKSNIAEAVQFVLGEQSIISLRGKRGEDLIFHGTKTMPRRGRAYVAIVFDNAQKIFDIDYEEVEVGRAVYRDGVSQYLINGSQTRLKDIIELLSSVHIGASSHHIISQGETDRILSASIKERRAMIEDALGLKIYQYKRAESERKLKKTRENIGHVLSLRTEIAPHLKFLEKQVQKIRQADEWREKLCELYKKYIAGERYYLKAAREKLDGEKKVTSEELRDIEKNIDVEEKELQKITITQTKNRESAALEQELRLIREQKDALSRTLGRLEGMLEYQKRAVEKAGKEEERETILLPKSALAGLQRKIESSLEEADAAEGKERIQEILAALRSFVKDFWETHIVSSTVPRAEGGAQKEYQKTKKELDVAVSTFEELGAKEKKLYSVYGSQKEEAEKGRGAERALERQIFALRGRKTELVSRLELLKVKDEQLEEEEKSFAAECDEARHFVGETTLAEMLKGGEVEKGGDGKGEQEIRKRKIERMKIKIEDIGSGSSDIMKEYEEVLGRDAYLAQEIEDLEKSAESLDNLIKELGEKIDKEFKDGIKKINAQFQELFVLMFGGGSASLNVVSPPPKRTRTSLESFANESELNPNTNPSSFVDNSGDTTFENNSGSFVDNSGDSFEGIDITVTLPHKRLKGLAMLSGGERALTSIALIFAITQVNPPPFLILDETDAALDESNSRKYGALLESISKETQLIVITHNRETMSRAGVLYGVTSAADGVSRLLSIKLDEAVELAE